MELLKGVSAGMLVSVVFLEALMAGMAAVLPPDTVLIEAIPGVVGLAPWPLWPGPALAWMLSAAAGAAMATGLAHRVVAGWLVGCLLALPCVSLVGLVTPGNPMRLVAAAIPLVAAGGGARLAQRIGNRDAAVSAGGQAV